MSLALAFAIIICGNIVATVPVNKTVPFKNDILGIDVGDMDDQSQRELILRIPDATKSASARWPGGIVPFSFSEGYTYPQQSHIRKAMSDFHQHTCVKFVPYSTERDFIYIVPGVGCTSYVGRSKLKQKVFLNLLGCGELGAIQHVLMHTIGFLHEQGRMDRDVYVEINWSNIEKKQHINFQSHNTPTFSLPYDFESVMHFKSNELAIVNEIWTIRPREEYSKHQIGQRKRMSQLDIARINKLYECSDRQNNSLDTTAKITGVPKPLA